MKAKLVQFPMGQGGFHAGFITYRDHTTCYIFDCGSYDYKHPQPIPQTKIIDHSLDYFMQLIKSYGCHEVDTLIVSHFHEDHVNGLHRLLERLKKSGIRIGKFFMPMYHDTLVEKVASIQSLGSPESGLPWAMEGRSEFIHTLAQDGTHIYVVASGEDTGEENNERELSRDEDSGFRIVSSGRPSETQGPQTPPAQTQVLYSPVRIRTGQSNEVWELRLWASPALMEHQEEFCTWLEHQLSEDLGKRYPEISVDEIAGWCFTKRGKNAIKDKTKELFPLFRGDLNETSLAVFSGPKMGTNAYSCLSSPWRDRAHRYPFWPTYAPAWLLTGDCNLNSKDGQNYDSFFQEMSAVATKVGYFCLPHHGSFKNYNMQFTSDFPNVDWWLANAGSPNSFNHPSLETLADLHAHGCTVYKVDESMNHIVVVSVCVPSTN